MKILVDREDIKNIFKLAKHINVYSLESNTLNKSKNIYETTSAILKANPVESDRFNPRDALISTKELAEIVAEGQRIYGDKPELSDRQAIIEILDMFIHGYFSGPVVEAASKIKAKLVGER